MIRQALPSELPLNFPAHSIVYICDNDSETHDPVTNRRKPLHYTIQEWNYRCTTAVSNLIHGHMGTYDPSYDGTPLALFRCGWEGCSDGLLRVGTPSENSRKRAYYDRLLVKDGEVLPFSTLLHRKQTLAELLHDGWQFVDDDFVQ